MDTEQKYSFLYKITLRTDGFICFACKWSALVVHPQCPCSKLSAYPTHFSTYMTEEIKEDILAFYRKSKKPTRNMITAKLICFFP